MTNLTVNSTNVEILKALNSVDVNDFEVEDSVYLNDYDATAIKYTHCDGYFFDDNFSNKWTFDPYDFDTDEEGRITMNSDIWLKSKF